MTRRARLLLLACAALAAPCAEAQENRPWLGLPKPVAPAPVKPKPALPVPGDAAKDAAYEAAKLAFEGLPEPQRRGVQDALVWTTDYNGVTVGNFGRRTYEGIQAWQRRNGLPPTGTLSAADRAALDAAAASARRAMRFAVKPDPGSGALIGVPEALLSRRSGLPRGTRWQSGDGRVTLDTVSYPADGADLDVLFARAAAATSERSVTYKLKKPDFFVVTGETATGRFYIRDAAGVEGIRGFTMSYDKTLADQADRLVIAVANSFEPFPGAAQATPQIAAPAAAFAPPTMPGLAHTPAATGLAIGGGKVLTAAAAIAACANPQAGGASLRTVAHDPAGALTLLAAERADALPASRSLPPLRMDNPAPGEAVVALGAQTDGAVVAPGVAESHGLEAPLQPGAGGAPVLDRSGRLVGLVAAFSQTPRLVAGVVPPTGYPMVPGRAVAAFLAQAGIAVPEAGAMPAATTLGAAAAPVLGSVVAIGCGR